MNREAAQPAWRGMLNWLPGVFFSLLAIYVLSRVVTWQQMVRAVQSMVLPLLIPAIGLFMAGMFLRTAAWRIILQRKVSYWKTFFAINEGYLLNNIFPLRLGELGRAVLLGRSSRLGMLPVLSAIVVERSFDLVISAGLLLITLPLALNMDWARPVAWVILLVVIAALAALALGARYREGVTAFAEKRGLARSRIGRWALPKLESLLGGFAALTDFRLFAASFAILASSWVLAMGEDWVLLRAFLPNPPIWWGGFIIGVAALGGALPSSSGAVGVLEAAVVTALVVLKVNQSTALAFGIVMHLIQLVITSILGLIGLARDGQSLAGIYHELRTRRSEPV